MKSGIYKYENLINHKIYIGQSVNLTERHKKHQKNIKDNSHQEELYKAFREFGFNNFSYEVLESFDIIDEQQLNRLECYYIDKFNSMFPNGYNMVPGGTNGAGLAKGKKIEMYDIKGNFIRCFDSAHQAEQETGINYSSICACCRQDIQHTKGFQWKYTDSDKDILDLSTQNIIIVNRKVEQYDLNNNLLNIYDSLAEASAISGISKPMISNVCRGKGRTAGGYKWRYQNNILPSNFSKNSKMVEQYTKNLQLLNTFSSIQEAAKLTNTNAGNISSVCKGQRKTANGYIWRYKN